LSPTRCPANLREMDRRRLAAWLASPHRTWRWKDPDDRTGYRAVETSDAGLRWYGWSHLFGEGGDGPSGEHLQTWANFRVDGPARTVPDDVREDLTALAARLADDPGASQEDGCR